MFGHQDQNEKEFRISTIGESCIIRDSERIPITSTYRESGPYPYYGANGLQDYVKDYIFDGEFVLVAEDGGYFDDPDRPIAYSVSGKCWVNNHAHILQPGKEINVQYLEWALKYRDVTNVINGTTRSKLTQAAMRSITILLPPKELQDSFSQFLIQVDKSKVIAQRAAEKYGQIIKSRFIEMFGTSTWNEKQWPTEKMKEVAPAIQSDNLPKSEGNWLLNLDAIQSNSGQILFKNRVSEAELNGSIMTFSSDHILYSKLRPYLNKVVVPDESGFGTTELIPLLPNKAKLTRTYLAYLLRSDAFVSKFSSAVAGTKMPRVSMDVFWKFDVPLPPMNLQKEFGSFVNQIDKSKLMPTIQQCTMSNNLKTTHNIKR